MNVKLDQLVQSVLQTNALSECSLTQLQSLAEQYPYSSTLQLLLTAKLKTEDPSAYRQQLQKTSLFFNDPLWLRYILENVTTEDPSDEKKDEVFETESSQILPGIKEVAASTLSAKHEESSNEQKEVKEELTFEPYHTIDYFASQGVKYTNEEKPKDKLGQQLKSFTEWLKTLRQVPVSEISKTSESPEEKQVEQLAAHSLEDRNVMTEAMAEVWEKQGNPAKAIEIYYKLGLLDPSKSSYFAAKIEQLKNLI